LEVKQQYILIYVSRQYTEDDTSLLEETWRKWQGLWLHEVKVVSKRMEPVKIRFKEITRNQRDNVFKKAVATFVKRYWTTGPGTVGSELEKGVVLLEVCVCIITNNKIRQQSKQLSSHVNPSLFIAIPRTI
jgi:hypothetical protein